MNIVKIHGWLGKPFCCPFCGVPEFDENDFERDNCCHHLLYIFGEGEYYYENKRFIEANRDEGKFANVVCFHSDNVNDISKTSFATIEGELI